MANSSTNLDTIAVNQSNKESVVNALFDAASPAMLWGRHASACNALTWGYYGGSFVDSTGTLHAVANGTLTLAASSTCYVQANPTTGAVSVNTTGFTAGQVPLYSIVTGASTVGSYTDCRSYQPSAVASSGGGGPNPYDVLMFFPSIPANAAIMSRLVTPRPVTLPASLTGSYASAEVAATAATTLSITRNGTSIGSVNFGAGATTGTFTFASAVTTAAGDILRLVNQATSDATLANISVTLTGTR